MKTVMRRGAVRLRRCSLRNSAGPVNDRSQSHHAGNVSVMRSSGSATYQVSTVNDTLCRGRERLSRTAPVSLCTGRAGPIA